LDIEIPFRYSQQTNFAQTNRRELPVCQFWTFTGTEKVGHQFARFVVSTIKIGTGKKLPKPIFPLVRCNAQNRIDRTFRGGMAHCLTLAQRPIANHANGVRNDSEELGTRTKKRPVARLDRSCFWQQIQPMALHWLVSKDLSE